MLVPKGKEEGFPIDLFIMISDYTGDAVSTFYTYRALAVSLRAYSMSGDENLPLSPALFPSSLPSHFLSSNENIPVRWWKGSWDPEREKQEIKKKATK